MSPVGLDVREYSYGIKEFQIPDGATYVMKPTVTGSTFAGWAVLKIFAAVPAAGPSQGVVFIDGNPVTINPGGCACLEPGGAFRGQITFIGEQLYLLVEYWWQGTPENIGPVVVVV